MNRARLGLIFAGAGLFAASLTAQTASTRVTAGYAAAVFTVDGQQYSGSANFTWPIGSKHVLEIATSQVLANQSTRIACSGWTDSEGKGITSNSITVTASTAITAYTAACAPTYRLMLGLTDLANYAGTEPTCDAPGTPPNVPIPGIVYVGGVCYWRSTVVEKPAGALTLAAYPYPGFVFNGWSLNGKGPDSYLSQIVLQGDLSLSAHFAPAKRVKFLTDPPGLKVLVDRAEIPTPKPDEDPCPFPMSVPAGMTSFYPRCVGVLDMGEGSQHVLAGATQSDSLGRDWVFSSFSNGLGLNGVYTARQVNVPEQITARFTAGAHVGIYTNPTGLKLKVDGRNNWPSYVFIWGVGTKHQVGAPPELQDSQGRKWSFKSWSNGGPADQEITVPADAVANPFNLYAKYELMSRLRVETTPPGLQAQVDGVACATPCVIDRIGGSQVKLTLPATLPVSDLSRMEMSGWIDGATGNERVLTLDTDTRTVVASYRTAHLLRTLVEPSAGASVSADPVSADGFYPSGTLVMLSAKARPGFRFRRWDGDLNTTSSVATMSVTAPSVARALLDRAPFISPAGVRNAAGSPAEDGVAPGSIISIFGASLGPAYDAGPASPLAQALSGVTVRIGDRLLPLLFVSPDQINAQLPSDLPEGTNYLAVTWEGHPEVTSAFEVVRNAPGLFAQAVDEKQFALVLHQDGSPVTAASPARQGEIVSIFGTGFGPYQRRVPDGFAVPDSPSYPLADPLAVVAGEQRITPVWSGAAPGFVGIAVAKVKIESPLPASATTGIRVEVNGKLSNAVLLPVE